MARRLNGVLILAMLGIGLASRLLAPARAPRLLLARGLRAPPAMMAFSARGGSGRSGGSGDSLSRRTREAAQLSEVLEEANVPLQRRVDGSVWATCPFHGDGNERTPSMKVDDEAGTFYCFACKESGSVFDFVMKTEDVEFGEAVRSLAERYEVEGFDTYSPRGGGAVSVPGARAAILTPAQTRLSECNEAAAEFYVAQLRTPGALKCAEMLRSRGVDVALAERFGLGYAPSTDGGALCRHLVVSLGFTPQEVIQAGLATRYESGNLVDRFRGRLMIPIHDPTGSVVGFGGRLVSDAGGAAGSGSPPPKYINSAASPIFQKEKTL